MDPTDELNDSLFLFHSLSPAQKTMLAGGIAGSVAKTVTAPLSRLTILYQVGNILSGPVAASDAKSSSSGGAFMRKEFSGSLLESSKRIIKEEGFRAFWKGNMTSVLHRFPYSAINFSTYEICRNYLCNDNEHNVSPPNSKNNSSSSICNNNNKNSSRSSSGNSGVSPRKCVSETPLTRFVSGAVSGAVACTACYPLDIIRTRLTVNTNSGSVASHTSSVSYHLIQIVRNEGVLGIYRGLAVSLAVSVPNLAIGFSSYGTIKDIMQNIDSSIFRQSDAVSSSISITSKSGGNNNSNSGSKLNSFGCLVAGATSGIISSLIIFPADIVRRRMQVIGLLGPPSATQAADPSRSILGQVRQIYAGAGIRGFYRGLIPELLKVTPMVGVTFFMYETTLGLLGHS